MELPYKYKTWLEFWDVLEPSYKQGMNYVIITWTDEYMNIKEDKYIFENVKEKAFKELMDNRLSHEVVCRITSNLKHAVFNYSIGVPGLMDDLKMIEEKLFNTAKKNIWRQ